MPTVRAISYALGRAARDSGRALVVVRRVLRVRTGWDVP
jgi:hypothetical protein